MERAEKQNQELIFNVQKVRTGSTRFNFEILNVGNVVRTDTLPEIIKIEI